MEIFNMFLEYFGIDMLTETSNIIDLVNMTLKIGLAIWLVTFVLRSIFYLVKRY